MKHIHLYKRVDIGSSTYDRKTRTYTKKKYLVFKCQKPGCSHYKQRKLLINEIAECNRCSEPFVLTRASLNLAKPHCADCIQVKVDDAAISLLNELEE